MRKVIFAVLFMLCFGAVIASAEVPHAQNTDSLHRESGFRMLDKPFMMTLSVGPNFNTGGQQNSALFGYRQDVVTQINCRFNIGFHRNWNIYTDLGFSIYRIKSEDYTFGDKLMEIFVPGFNKIHPSFSLGASYLTQIGRWQFMPRLGAGCINIRNRNTRKEYNGVKTNVRKEISPYFIEGAVGIGFRTSRICSLIFDVCYHHPLESAEVTIKRTENDRTTIQSFKSDSWANDLTLAIGIQFQTNLSKRKQPRS